ncbi:MAG: 4-(cytidine 5'-diphospho)-2-C-methyl-D-erythritol kinase [Betaproteobacteria bacterium HGW-Betaproteobacteria-11]|nr:MAG: 4-(cytidine 5'-diphospho)-2-C-methyl-D-erythritol kinase [Betaproteobacteria bacterium HGW-Betaproteobacteria-11]
MADGWSRWWPAPAKLNLFLHVVGRRADGYHLLQTVFRFLDLGDRLRFSPRDDGSIVLATPLPGVADERNLVVRAARALQKLGACLPAKRNPRQTESDTANDAWGATIHLEKSLPQGGGLGGGSSDAATTLLALNRLWGCKLDAAALQRIGLGLGADVPIFIHGHTAFAEGVGERFTDVAPPPAWYLVLVPPVAVPTATIFAAPELVRNTPPIAAADWFPGFGRNDLEAVARARFPEIAAHLDWLRRWGDARLSGSGACCFVGFDSEAPARTAHAALPPGMRGFIARGIDRHPLAM